jgi:hypothetical protein
MKKVLIGVGVGLVVLVGGFVGVVAMQPNELVIERKATVAASPEQLQPLCADLQKWETWNPWHDLDPNMKLTYGSVTAGEGASYSWEGNDDVGKGSMEVLKVEPGMVEYALRFEEPFQDQSIIRISFEPEGEKTQVVWRMEGENTFMTKMIGLFMDMDALVGKDFEKGLRNLEAAAQG